MYSVYKITNLINQKSYIGSSINYKKRWEQHKNISQNPNSKYYKYPLYCAFRKYGIENFSFEVLSTSFNSAFEMQDYEHEMIIKYDSLQNGYNQTLHTENALQDEDLRKKIIEKNSQKCALVDINNNIIEIYDSYQDASRKLGANNQASHIRSVCKGEVASWNGKYFRDLDENNNIIFRPFKKPHGKTSVIAIPLDNELNPLYFESKSAASEVLKISRQSISKCIKGDFRYSNVAGYIWRELDIYGNIINNDLDVDSLINKYNETHPLINGERRTISEWCRIFNISRPSVYKRIEKGMSVVEALTKEKER